MKYVATLARHLSIHPRFRDALQGNAIALLTASAPLHDIGKVGIPDGLAGEAIPVSARLMAVADVFDALVTSRVYKPTLPFEQANNIIAEGRGRHFDPDMVDAFIKVHDEFVDIATRYADTSMEQKD